MATKKKTTETARLGIQKTFKLYIGGAFPRTESGRYLKSENHKGEFVANICRASRKDFRNSVVAARKAQHGWASRTAFNRAQILYRMAEMLESRRVGFESALGELAGYSAKNAAEEVDAAVDRLVWYAGWADKFPQIMGSTNPVASPHFNFTMPEATGVVAVLAPTKSPLLGLVSALAPVIVSGNAAVVIVENDAPSIAIDLAEVFHCSDLPGGVVNILTGLRDELVTHIGSHMDVDAVLCCSPSDEERKTIGVEAAENVKMVKFLDDPKNGKWASEEMQTPYLILSFVEFKTAWHPVGV
ncbi:MAG: aldehyde dehydrogenase family protein [Bradymonadaceae bacterium]